MKSGRIQVGIQDVMMLWRWMPYLWSCQVGEGKARQQARWDDSGQIRRNGSLSEELLFRPQLISSVAITSLWPRGWSDVGVFCGRREVDEGQGM